MKFTVKQHLLILTALIIPLTAISQNKAELLLKAEEVLLKGDTIMATERFREILVVYPQSFTAAMRLAEIYQQRKDYHTAIQFVNVALDINDNYQVQTKEKIESKQLSQNELAEEQNRLNKYKSDQADIHHLKGVIRTRQLRRQDAIDEFRKALELKVSSQTLTDLALTYLEIGLLHDALKLLHQARSIDSTSYKPYFNLANVHYKVQNTDSALYYYQRAQKKKRDLKWPYLYSGLIYTQKEDYSKAIDQYNSYIAIDSANEEVYFRRAVLYSELRQWPEALGDWTHVLKLNPKNAEAWRNKGLSHFQVAQYDSAITAFDEALKILPEESYTYINRGYSYYLINNPEQALQDLNKGLEGLPKYYLGYYFRALVYLQINKKQKACNNVHKAIELGMKQSEIDEKLLKKCF
ncbi:tetratricopeptide repeat protein [Fulvivirga sp. 29W222]|uniref:Tetratricopeptide repeat protein n=1 Tax=Fulvivirga marina TaxID=2494733 RepID=A0A937KAU3_9BACT|nr:tetratricopeptide repeat protein [Fulvivirga marina]MBL6445067.1 tetratricopeptide repeat protein [Fulvivirga marina]